MSSNCFAGEIKGMPTITDGDTLKILNENIRLDGIDAPEIGQNCIDKNGNRYDCGKLRRKIRTTKYISLRKFYILSSIFPMMD